MLVEALNLCHVFSDSPRDTQISPAANVVDIRDTLTCTSRANPGVNVYEWLRDNDTVIGNSAALSVPEQWLRQTVAISCTVQNTMRDDVTGDDVVHRLITFTDEGIGIFCSLNEDLVL